MSQHNHNHTALAEVAVAALVTPAVVEATPAAVATTTPTAVEKTAEQLAALHTEIKAKFNNLVDVVPTNFHFRKVKDEASGVDYKRPTVKIPLPVPSVEGIIEILQAGGKQLELLQEAVSAIIIENAREWINENEAANEDNFPYAKMSWEAIANLPKAERRGGGIPKEVWEAFAKDYIAVMPAVTGKTKEQVEKATKIYLTKFSTCQTDKKVLQLLKDQLAIYITNTTEGESYADCVAALDKKVETLLEADSTNLLAAL